VHGGGCFVLLVLILASFFCLSSATYSGNYALSFDGKNDYVLIGHQVVDSLLVNSWTVEAWIKASPNQNPGNNGSRLGNIIGFPWRSPNLELCDSNHPVCTEGVMLTQLRDAKGKYFTRYGTKKVNDNKWHHVAGTWSDATLSLYVDGVLDVSSYPYSEGFNISKTCDENCSIGFQIGGALIDDYAAEYFNGVIDEVRVWTVPRSQDDIKASMSKTILSDDDLLYYWRFDEGMGSVVQSIGTYNAPGTLGGGIPSADPKWVSSDCPITLTPDPDDSYWEPHVTRGAFAVVSVLMLSCVVGFLSAIVFTICAPKFSFFKSMFDRHNNF